MLMSPDNLFLTYNRPPISLLWSIHGAKKASCKDLAFRLSYIVALPGNWCHDEGSAILAALCCLAEENCP